MAAVLLAGCSTSSSGDSIALPLIEPPVKAASPAGFAVGRRASTPAAGAMLSAADFRDRFFNPMGGPTDVFRILGSIDERLREANTASAESFRPCTGQDAVAYAIAPFGQDMMFAAQCYRTFGASTGGPAAFMQFGQSGDVTELFITGGASRLAARVTGTGSDVVVDAWYGVGYTNAMCGMDGTFDGCSYAVTQIHAEPATRTFEMTVAGIGVGYCGIQIRSDGTSIYGVGSPDMGITCAEPATLCADAGDLSAPGACDALTTFTLPALGRASGAGAHEFGATTYPALPNITLDGTPSDSLGFGPGEGPTPGVGDFDAH